MLSPCFWKLEAAFHYCELFLWEHLCRPWLACRWSGWLGTLGCWWSCRLTVGWWSSSLSDLAWPYHYKHYLWILCLPIGLDSLAFTQVLATLATLFHCHLSSSYSILAFLEEKISRCFKIFSLYLAFSMIR